MLGLGNDCGADDKAEEDTAEEEEEEAEVNDCIQFLRSSTASGLTKATTNPTIKIKAAHAVMACVPMRPSE